MRVGVHAVAENSWSKVFDKSEAKRASAVLVSLEFCNSCLRCLSRIKPNNARAPGAATRLILDLGLFDLANRSKKLDEVFVACRPGKLLNGQRELVG